MKPITDFHQIPDFVTIVSTDRWPHALTLYRSLTSTYPNSSLTVVVTDGAPLPSVVGQKRIRVIRSSDLTDPRIQDMRKRYTNLEFACALKPFVIRHLLFKGPVFYLDSDIYVYSPLVEACDHLTRSAMLLTPHRFTITPDDGFTPTQASLIATGIYNAGFVGARDHADSWRLLSEWERHCYLSCIDDRQAGFFLDQKWLDIAPALISSLRVIHHSGYNIGYWNADERISVLESPSQCKHPCDQLRFIHFSGVNPLDDSRLSINGDRMWHIYTPQLLKLVREYCQELRLATKEVSPVPFTDD